MPKAARYYAIPMAGSREAMASVRHSHSLATHFQLSGATIGTTLPAPAKSPQNSNEIPAEPLLQAELLKAVRLVQTLGFPDNQLPLSTTCNFQLLVLD